MSKQEHPYAEILRAIADGEEVQYLNKFFNEWMNVSHISTLRFIYEEKFEPEYIRIKPQTININGYEIPEPMRVAPPTSTLVYIANPADTELATQFYAGGAIGPMTLCFESGLCHSTKEAAVLHAKALLSFTLVTKE